MYIEGNQGLNASIRLFAVGVTRTRQHLIAHRPCRTVTISDGIEER